MKETKNKKGWRYYCKSGHLPLRCINWKRDWEVELAVCLSCSGSRLFQHALGEFHPEEHADRYSDHRHGAFRHNGTHIHTNQEIFFFFGKAFESSVHLVFGLDRNCSIHKNPHRNRENIYYGPPQFWLRLFLNFLSNQSSCYLVCNRYSLA